MKRLAIQDHVTELYDEIQRLEQEIDDLLLGKNGDKFPFVADSESADDA